MTSKSIFATVACSVMLLTGCWEASSENGKSRAGGNVGDKNYRLDVDDVSSSDTHVIKRLTIQGDPENFVSLGLGHPPNGLSGMDSFRMGNRTLVATVTCKLKISGDSKEDAISVSFEVRNETGAVAFGPVNFPIDSSETLSDHFSVDVSPGTYELGKSLVIGHVADHDMTLTVSPGKQL